MPLRDGTGPLGLGPGSGRRKGGCYAGFGYRSMSRGIFHGRQGWLLSIGVPLVAAILRDLLNPSGIIRRIIHVSPASKINNSNDKTISDVEYTEVSVHSVPQAPKGNTCQ